MQSSGSQQVSRAAADGRTDFDWLFGRWRVSHKRLRTRLAGDTNWDEFFGSCEALPMLGGLGNMDDNVLELPGDTYRAVTVRTFDPATRLWSIWWIDGRNPSVVDVPVRGAFQKGIGTFTSDDEFEGRPINVRFRWFDVTPTTACWDQAFSEDGGSTWETNWTMEFVRA